MEEHLKKLEPFVREIGSKAPTYFMATRPMYFPFLTCEVLLEFSLMLLRLYGWIA